MSYTGEKQFGWSVAFQHALYQVLIQCLLWTAVKAITAAQLSMASHGVYSVTLDEAIEAMRLTAADMSVKYKETSLSVCARCVI
jgi:L-serine deaminase